MYKATEALKDNVWNRKDFVGNAVAEKTFGARMKAFPMKVIGYDSITSAELVRHRICITGRNLDTFDYIT